MNFKNCADEASSVWSRLGKMWSQTGSRFSGAIGYLKLAFTPIAVTFLLYFGWQSRETLLTVIRDAQPLYLASAFLAWIVLHFVAPVLATLILNACGSPVTYRFSFKTHAGRLPARYLPGGIWHTVGRMVDFHGEGIKPSHLTVLVFLEIMLPAAVTLTYGGLFVLYARGFVGWGQVAAFGPLGGILALVVSYLFLNRQTFRSARPMPLGTYIKCIAVVSFFWLIATTSFISYLTAFPTAMGASPLLDVAGAYLFSWGIGYISLFAPQGIGVFEAVAGNMLVTPMSFGEMAALIAGFRIISLVADGVVWGVSRLTYLAS